MRRLFQRKLSLWFFIMAAIAAKIPSCRAKEIQFFRRDAKKRRGNCFTPAAGNKKGRRMPRSHTFNIANTRRGAQFSLGRANLIRPAKQASDFLKLFCDGSGWSRGSGTGILPVRF
jgi:hypothetical protein